MPRSRAATLCWTSTVLVLAWFALPTKASELDAEPQVDPPDDPAALYDIPCADGFADVFPCSHVDLLALLPLSVFDEGQANDIWGWTSEPSDESFEHPGWRGGESPRRSWWGNFLRELWRWARDDPREHSHDDHPHEYALIGLRNGTAFVDVTEPTAPIYIGFLPSHTTGSPWRDIKTYGDYAFIVSEARRHGMQVFDLTQLDEVTSPPVTFSESAHYSDFRNAHNIAINEDTGRA